VAGGSHGPAVKELAEGVEYLTLSPEASVTSGITADLDAAGLTLPELQIDRAYLSSSLVRDRGPGLAVFCRAWRVRNTTGRFPKGQFSIGFAAGQLTCPAGVSIGFQPGRTVHFPKVTCAACPLRERCTPTRPPRRPHRIQRDCPLEDP
jgi:transposase